MTAHLVTLSAARCGQTLVNGSNAAVVWVDDASGDAEGDAGSKDEAAG